MSGESGAAAVAPGARVTLLTRTNCYLCEPVKATVADVCLAAGESWDEVDVDADPELQSEFGDQVPVVLVDGEFLSSFRLDADTLRAALNHS